MHKAQEGFALTRANALGPSGWRPLAEAIHGADSDRGRAGRPDRHLAGRTDRGMAQRICRPA